MCGKNRAEVYGTGKAHAIWKCNDSFSETGRNILFGKGTLVGYEKFFHREFKFTVKQESVIYWSEEQNGWRRFRISNLMEWKAIV